MGEKQRTTMSVREMRQMLGLGKTEAYWLVHKQRFQTLVVNGMMRVVIESFEHWYRNLVKYQKVDGSPPGEELRSYSYSVQEIAEELGIDPTTAYEVIKRDNIETFEVDFCKRIRKDVFEEWYSSQNKYRTKADRERDKELEAATMTMPEMARLLLLHRNEVYRILLDSKHSHMFEFVYIAGKRRVTKESFERWYSNQNHYRKLCDRTSEEISKIESLRKETETPRLKVDERKSAFTLQEAAVLLDLSYNEVRSMIRNGELEAIKCGTKYMISRDELKWFLLQQTMEREN